MYVESELRAFQLGTFCHLRNLKKGRGGRCVLEPDHEVDAPRGSGMYQWKQDKRRIRRRSEAGYAVDAMDVVIGESRAECR